MARITRKELKTDKFALEVEHTVDFFDRHRRDILRYGGAALVLVLLVAGLYYYRKHQHAARERVLAQALQVLEAPAGQQATPSTAGLSFPTEQARNQEAAKRFGELATKHPGTPQGLIAEYTLASIAADEGRLLEAEKRFRVVADSGDKNYGSLAKMSLAEIYFASNRTAEGEELLRSLMNNPTIFVSKDQATIALARGIGKSKPAEARKLIDPLRGSQDAVVSQAAIQLHSEIAQ